MGFKIFWDDISNSQYINLKDSSSMMNETLEMKTTNGEGIPTQGDMEIHDVLRGRWSPKVFSEEPVEPEKLRTILEAARWAPSSFNEQPWSFIVARRENHEEYSALLSSLGEKNQGWARRAPVLILSVAKLNLTINGQLNRHAFHDVGLATANLIVQASALGLFTHPMGGFSVEKARAVFGIPEGYEPVAVIALGYLPQPDEPGESTSSLVAKNRSRKPLGEFVYEGRWGHRARFINDHEDQAGRSIEHMISAN
jgi:nitroreductase